MSHISVLKISFSDRDLLLQALRDLGYTVREGDDLSVSDGSKQMKVGFTVGVPFSDAPIGFRKGKNGWQPAADWFRILIDRKKFESALKQQYAVLSVKRSLQEQGFMISEENRNEKNEVHLVLRRVRE